MTTDTTYKSKVAKGVTFEVLKSCGRTYLYVKQDCTQKYIVNFTSMPCKRVNEIRKYVDMKFAKIFDWSKELNKSELKSVYKEILGLQVDLACGGHYEVWHPQHREFARLKPIC